MPQADTPGGNTQTRRGRRHTTPHHTAGLNKGSIQTTKVMEDSLDIACVVPDARETAFRIHCLKRSAYVAVLRAFCAQSDLLSRAKEECLAELRNELKISDTEHREYLVKASTDTHIKSLSGSLYRGNISNAEAMKDPLDLACVIPDGGDTVFQIHCLERSAYASILRAFCAQPDLISWVEKLFREEPDPGILETVKSILKAQERHLLDALV